MGIFDIFKKKQKAKNEIKTIDLSKYENMSDEELLTDRIKTMEDSISNNEIDELIMNESIKIIKSRNMGSKVITPLLELLERNPLVNFGSPGAIVHYLEKLDGYKEQLVKSIKKIPTLHTIWMLNRCINIHDEKEREYMNLLRSILSRNDVNNTIKESAKEFIEFQESENE